MSKRRRHAHPCPNATKTPYPDKISCELAIARIRSKDDPSRETLPVHAYRCECGRWHMTSRAHSYAEIAEILDHDAT